MAIAVPVIFLLICLYWMAGILHSFSFTVDTIFQLMVSGLLTAFFVLDIRKRRKLSYDNEAIYLFSFFSRSPERIYYADIISITASIIHIFPPFRQYIIRYYASNDRKETAFVYISSRQLREFRRVLEGRLPTDRILF